MSRWTRARVAGAFLVSIGLLFSCGEENTPNPPIPVEPVIELLSVNPTAVVALQDSLVFRLEYTDGDGNLGFEEADSAVVYLTDNRFPLTEEYHVPPVAPVGEEIAVTGVWLVVLSRTIMQEPTAASEVATFSIRIRDRAGNWSNTETSDPVIVYPD